MECRPCLLSDVDCYELLDKLLDKLLVQQLIAVAVAAQAASAFHCCSVSTKPETAKRCAGQWTYPDFCWAMFSNTLPRVQLRRIDWFDLGQPRQPSRLDGSTLSGVLGLDKRQGCCARSVSPGLTTMT